MAFGDASSPIRFGGGQVGTTNRELFLDIFGGEVLTAFFMETVTLGRVMTKTLRNARSAKFPRTWKAIAEYHTPGQEMLGNAIETTERIVTVDDILVSHTGVADLDDMLSHFEVRSSFAQSMGASLAEMLDKNNFRQMALAPGLAADGPFPQASAIASDTLKPTAGVYDGMAWLTQIREATATMFDKDVPDYLPRYMAVPGRVFDAIKYAQDGSGNYLVLNRDFNGENNGGGVAGRAKTLQVDDVTLVRTNNLPNTNESAVQTVYAKYRGDFSKLLGVMWVPPAIGVAQVMGINIETSRDTRRLEDFMVAKTLVGSGTLREEGIITFNAVT